MIRKDKQNINFFMKRLLLVGTLTFSGIKAKNNIASSDLNQFFSPPEVDINYVLDKYEQTIFGKKVLFYPVRDPQRMLIIFSPFKNKYSRWSWFWEKDQDWQNTAYLFLQPGDDKWYVGSDKKPLIETFCAIINHFIRLINVNNEQVFTTGNSKGGYAAILYALKLNLKGVIAYDPIITKESWLHTNLKRDIKDTGNQWIDLDNLVRECDDMPFFSISYGSNPRDVEAIKRLLDVLREKDTLIILRKFKKKNHGGLIIPKIFLEKDIDFIESQGILWDIYKKIKIESSDKLKD